MGEARVLLVVNPAAQRGNVGRMTESVYRRLAEHWGTGGVDLVLTERPGHAVELAAGAHTQVVVALGGDGLVHEVVNGLMSVPAESRPVFGLIPAGSGNDYARTLGMSEKVDQAIGQLFEAHEKELDVGCCNGTYFAETLSFGLDAAIALDTVQRRQKTGQQGTMLYLSSGIDQLLHHLDAFSMEATLGDGRKITAPVHLIAVQNGPTYGGGFRICPDADPADGLLDICYAEAPMSVPEATFKFLRAKNAHHTKFKNIHFARASELVVAFDRRPPCQIDGEPHLADEYRISVAPRALRALVASAE